MNAISELLRTLLLCAGTAGLVVSLWLTIMRLLPSHRGRVTSLHGGGARQLPTSEQTPSSQGREEHS